MQINYKEVSICSYIQKQRKFLFALIFKNKEVSLWTNCTILEVSLNTVKYRDKRAIKEKEVDNTWSVQTHYLDSFFIELIFKFDYPFNNSVNPINDRMFVGSQHTEIC